jgi:hypothetical protein
VTRSVPCGAESASTRSSPDRCCRISGVNWSGKNAYAWRSLPASQERQPRASYWQTPDPLHVPQQVELSVQGDPAGSQAQKPVVRLQLPLQHWALLVHGPFGPEFPNAHAHSVNAAQKPVQHCPLLTHGVPRQLTQTPSWQTSK